MNGSSLMISPAEPATLRNLLDATPSLLTEENGVDFLWRTRGAWWGAQRKTVTDFLASLHDGRLARELSQMRHISMPLMIIEGPITWTIDGYLMNVRQKVTRQQWQGMMFTVLSKGVGIMHTSNAQATADLIELLYAWTVKARHTSVTARPKQVSSSWGEPGDRDWGIHILQGFDGIGYDTAANIFDHFGGVPLQWTEDITQVRGVGKGRAEKASRGLCPPHSRDNDDEQ